VKIATVPLQLLPEPPLAPDALDFTNRPAIVDNGTLVARMPRRLTPLEEGLRTYLPANGGVTIAFDRPAESRGQRAIPAPDAR